MTNKQIAYAFDDLAKLMELHEEDDFRVKSYKNAYLTLRKIEPPLSEMQDAEIKSIKGVGTAIAGKIRELVTGGTMASLEKYKADTPPGVVEMLEINGFGPKKIRVVWRDMGIESVGELWYACNENRLIEYTGFGLKTQEDLRLKLEYYFKSRDKLHIDAALAASGQIQEFLKAVLPDLKIESVGALRRLCPVVDQIELLAIDESGRLDLLSSPDFTWSKIKDNTYHFESENLPKAIIYTCESSEWGSKLFKHTGSADFLNAFILKHSGIDFKHLPTEIEVFEKIGLSYIEPELRELLPDDFPFAKLDSLSLAQNNQLPDLLVESDIRGLLHVHTTWSDGLHSLKDMCAYAKALGYEYIGITDHSQAAFYANGLKPDRVLAQMAEIDALNTEMAPFRILKGIESDILNDGSLDYDDDLLAKFDFVIASVHTNLKMSSEKATERILKAIGNPYTTILGHPTSRLLLSREGYPLDWKAIFDACQAHNVAIELNANPYRLDLDWTLIQEALKRGIKICINPDAHSKEGLLHVKYGLMAARKGGLTKEGYFYI